MMGKRAMKQPTPNGGVPYKDTLRAKILKALRSSTIPMATPDIVALFAPNITNARSQIHVLLQKMYEAGQVQRTAGTQVSQVSPHNRRAFDRHHDTVYWRAVVFSRG